jgi:hypothetical protein
MNTSKICFCFLIFVTFLCGWINSDQPPIPAPMGECWEFAIVDVCITKSNCCYVANTYKGYRYEGCIDIRAPDNKEKFCNNFYSLNNGQGYTPEICVCNLYRFPATSVASSGYISASYAAILFGITIQFLM